MLTLPVIFGALTDLPGRWIDAVHDRRPPKMNNQVALTKMRGSGFKIVAEFRMIQAGGERPQFQLMRNYSEAK